MTGSIKLGRVLGIPLQLHYSWFLVLLLVTSSVFTLLGEVRPFWTLTERWLVALAASTLLFVSVVAHELSHSIVARRNGIPVKGITLFVFGGVAQISREAASPLVELLIALAGPLCSILLGLAFLGLSFIIDSVSIYLSVIVEWLFVMNIALGVFNLIPGFPLDGGRVFRALVWAVSGNFATATRIATIGGKVTALAFLAFGVGIVLLERNFVQGAWLAFIGWFLWQVGSANFRQFKQLEAMRGVTARDIMNVDLKKLPSGALLSDFIDKATLLQGSNYLVVAEAGNVVGVLDITAVRKLSKGDWVITRIGDVAIPLNKLPKVSLEEEFSGVKEALDESDFGVALVVDAERIIGVVVREQVLRYMRVHFRISA